VPTRRSIRFVSPAPRASDAPKPHVPSSLSSRAQIELKTGETYRGTLLESEDNWNCQLSGITHTGKDGRVNQLEHAYIRGSKIRFLVIPDMLKNAPMFKRIDPKAGGRGGRGGGGRGAGGRGGRGGRGGQ
jgi:small nuclear ribonucleoprotein D3